MSTETLGITNFLRDYHTLVGKYAPHLGGANTQLNNSLSKLITTSYENVVDILVCSEVARQSDAAIIDKSMHIKIEAKYVHFDLDIATLSWNIRGTSSGVTADFVKAENEVSANMDVAKSFTALQALIQSKKPDLLTYIEAKAVYVLYLSAVANEVVIKVNASIEAGA